MCVLSSIAIASALGLTATVTSGAAAGTVISTAPLLTGALATLGNVGLAVGGIGSAVMGVASGIQQSQAAQAQADYESQVAQQNAKIAEQNAMRERQAGLEDARRQRLKTVQAIGNQQVALAANGAELGTGTAVDVVEDTATMGELDALMTQYNAEQRALNYEQQANNYRNQSNLAILRGQNSSKAGTINAISSGFSGLSSSLNTVAGLGLGQGKRSL